MQFYNLVTRSVYKTGDYKLDPGRHTNTYFGLTYDGGIFVVTYISYYGITLLPRNECLLPTMKL